MSYAKITHSQRILVVYLKVIHELPLEKIAELSGVKYNTIRNILKTYKRHGRTNKKAYEYRFPKANQNARKNRPQMNSQGRSGPGSDEDSLSM